MKNSKSKHSELTSFWRRCVRFHVWIEREPNKSFTALCDCKVHVFFCRLIGLKLAMVSMLRCQIADWVRSIYIQLHWSLYGELKGIVFSASSPAKIIAFDLKVIFMIINARPSNFSGFFSVWSMNKFHLLNPFFQVNVQILANYIQIPANCVHSNSNLHTVFTQWANSMSIHPKVKG